jgi:hypothetical protein
VRHDPTGGEVGLGVGDRDPAAAADCAAALYDTLRARYAPIGPSEAQP